MGFTREDMDAYEKQPQTKIDDKVSPFRGATPAKVADPAAIAAVAAGQVDVSPTGANATSAVNTDDSPVVDEDGTIGDPTESGEGTSDVTAESSTATVDSGDEVDPNSDLTGSNATDEAVAPAQAPKKGSAQERIVELNDLLEGTKIFGNYWKEQWQATQDELIRVKSGSATATPASGPQVDEIKDEPMPELSDPDVNFDNDKYRSKIAKWTKDQATLAARAAIREANGQTAAKSLESEFDNKVAIFTKAHPDFDKVVTRNPVLNANQLHQKAGLEVMRSEHAADLLYAFGQDVAMAIRVSRMPLEQQLKHIGRMEASIEAAKAAKSTASPTKKVVNNQQPAAQAGARKSITQAPPPPRVTPAAGRAEARSVVDPGMSMDEFARRHREEKQAGRSANRKARGLG